MIVRRLLKDSAVYTLTRVLTGGTQIVLLPIYTRLLSPADYGAIELILIFVVLVKVIFALEINQGVARYFSDTKDRAERTKYASTGLWFAVGALGLFLLGSWVLAADGSELLLGSSGDASLFRLGALYAFSYGLLDVVQNQLRWQLQPSSFAVTVVLQTALSVAVSLGLILVFDAGAAGMIYGYFAGTTIGALIGLYFARKSFSLTFDVGKLKEMLSFSFPLVIVVLGSTSMRYVDRIAIKELLSVDDVGLYAVAFRIAALMTLVTIGVQGALTPLVFSYFRDERTPAELARIFRYFLLISLTAFIGLSLFPDVAVKALAGPEFSGAATLVPLLAAAILLSGLYIFTPGLWIAKKTGRVALINITSAALNGGLNFILIPFWGISGAAWATVASASLRFGAQMVSSQRIYHVPHQWRALGPAFGVSVLCSGTGALLQGHLSGLLLLLGSRLLVFLLGAALLVRLLIDWRKERPPGLGKLVRLLASRGRETPNLSLGSAAHPGVKGDEE